MYVTGIGFIGWQMFTLCHCYGFKRIKSPKDEYIHKRTCKYETVQQGQGFQVTGNTVKKRLWYKYQFTLKRLVLRKMVDKDPEDSPRKITNNRINIS